MLILFQNSTVNSRVSKLNKGSACFLISAHSITRSTEETNLFIFLTDIFFTCVFIFCTKSVTFRNRNDFVNFELSVECIVKSLVYIFLLCTIGYYQQYQLALFLLNQVYRVKNCNTMRQAQCNFSGISFHSLSKSQTDVLCTKFNIKSEECTFQLRLQPLSTFKGLIYLEQL